MRRHIRRAASAAVVGAPVRHRRIASIDGGKLGLRVRRQRRYEAGLRLEKGAGALHFVNHPALDVIAIDDGARRISAAGDHVRELQPLDRPAQPQVGDEEIGRTGHEPAVCRLKIGDGCSIGVLAGDVGQKLAEGGVGLDNQD